MEKRRNRIRRPKPA